MASGPPRPRKKRHLDEHPDDHRPASHSVGLLTASMNLREPTEAPGEKQRSFTDMFDRLRSIATCKICFRMLYEPYSLSCGHIYCYSCLCQWFNKGDAKKTCPDCRAVVKTSPAPAFLVREMTQELIQHPEILPEGETKEQHEQWKEEEADIVERDRLGTDTGSGGLFSGIFKSQRRRRYQPIRDEEDGVWRCPGCNWELEEGGTPNCPRCELDLDSDMENSSFSGSDFDNESELNTLDSFAAQRGTFTSDEESDDLDAELDMPDAELQLDLETHSFENGMDAYYDSDSDDELPGFDVSIEHVRGRRRAEDDIHRLHSHAEGGSRYAGFHQRTPSPYPSGDDVASTGDGNGDEEEEEEYDSAMDDFIADDEEADAADSEGSESGSDASDSTQRQASPDDNQVEQSSAASIVTSTGADASGEESDEGGAVSRGYRRRLALPSRSRTLSRRRRSSTTTISADDNDSGDDESDPTEEDESVQNSNILGRHGLTESSLAPLDSNSDGARVLDNVQANHGMFGMSRKTGVALPAVQRRPVNHWIAQQRRRARVDS